MKTKTLLVSLVLALALLFSACASPTPATVPTTAVENTKAPEPTTPPQPTATSVPPTLAPTAAPTEEPEVTLTVWTDETQINAVTGMVDAAKEEFGVTLVVQQLNFDDMLTQFQMAAPAGEGPDIIIQPHNVLGEVVKNGLVQPLDLGALIDKFAPAAVSAWQYNGEQYGLPINTENVGFFINTDVVPECPATWTEVMNISKEISANNTDNLETNKYGFVRMEKDPYHFFPILTAFGGYVFGVNEMGYNPQDVGLDSEGALAAAKFWDEHIKAKLQPAGVDGETMLSLFETGKSAMTITGPWNVQRLVDSGIQFKVCPIPGEVEKHGRPFMGSYGYMVSAFSKNPEVADIFVKEFLAREENMRALYDESPSVPANLAVLASIDDPYLAAFAEAGKDAIPMPAIPEMESVWAAWRDAILLIAQQGDTPEHAFQTAAEQIRTLIAEGK